MVFRSRRPPGPGGVFGVRNLIALDRAMFEFAERQQRDHGDLVRVPLLGREYYFLYHPDDIEAVLVRHDKQVRKDEMTRGLSRALGQGLVTSDGDTWRRHRKLVSFAFTPKRIRTYAESMVEVGARGLTNWRDGQVLDIHDEMSRITMEVVGEVLFGADVDADTRAVGRAMEHVNEFFSNSLEMYLRLPDWVPTPRLRRFGRAVRIIDEVVYRIIDQRRRRGRGASAGERDLLGALFDAQEHTDMSLSSTEVRDHCVTLFLAGHETTALALVHALYFLGCHPEVEALFHAELKSVLGGCVPSVAQARQLVYTERVIKEAMRLYPPVWGVGREVVQPFELRGYVMPRGAQLLTYQWVVHRDPRWYRDSLVFDPDRWLPERANRRPRLSYFPFGAGPRICIGNHLAMMESILLLALIGQRYRLRPMPGERMEFQPSVTLRPRYGGLNMSVYKRDTHVDGSLLNARLKRDRSFL